MAQKKQMDPVKKEELIVLKSEMIPQKVKQKMNPIKRGGPMARKPSALPEGG